MRVVRWTRLQKRTCYPKIPHKKRNFFFKFNFSSTGWTLRTECCNASAEKGRAWSRNAQESNIVVVVVVITFMYMYINTRYMPILLPIIFLLHTYFFFFVKTLWFYNLYITCIIHNMRMHMHSVPQMQCTLLCIKIQKKWVYRPLFCSYI